MPERPQTNAYILGVGMTPFIKPRRIRDYVELGYEAGVKAMLDAGINYDDVETGVACYCYGDTTSGQRIFYQFGMNAIPIYNTNNACATGSTGLHMARTLVRAGAVDCVLVIGFEMMQPGSIKSGWNDRPSPMELATNMMEDTRGKHDSPRNAQYFGNAGREYMEKYVLAINSIFGMQLHAHGSAGTVPKTKTSQKSLASAMSTPSATHMPSSGRSTPYKKLRTQR